MTEKFNDLPVVTIKEEKQTAKPKKEKKETNTKRNRLIAVLEYLTENFDFRFNLFAQRPEYKLKDEGDEAFNFFDQRAFDNLYIDLQVSLGVNVTVGDLHSIIGSDKIAIDYDPMKAFIFGLPKWDGKDRFPEFLERIKLKDEEQRAVMVNAFKKWFINAIASIVEDHVYNENCFVLVGTQGVGKTRFLRTLCPEELRMKYVYSGDFEAGDKDHLEMLGTKLFFILEEMGTFNRTDAERMKGVMSTDHIVLRRAYGRENIYLWRHASFAASINEENFLTDQSGNRRWLPFIVEEIEHEKPFEIELLYAQALAEYRDGFRVWFDREEIKELEKHNEPFRHRSMEEELIIVNYRVPTEQERELGIDVEYLQTSDIMHRFGSDDSYKKYNVNDSTLRRLGRALRSMGFRKLSKKREGDNHPVYVWEVVKNNKQQAEQVRRGEKITTDSLLQPPTDDPI